MNFNEIDLNTLSLNTPNSISGNYYFSKLSLNNSNNFEFKLNSSTLCKKITNLKNGDNYYFFEFKENDENLNTFLQDLEDKVIETLYEKSEEWFENNVTIDDIKDSTYGFIKNNKGKINIKLKINSDTYDVNSIVLNDKLVSVDDFNLLDSIIPVVQLKGIKFNPKNFYIVLELKDYISMISETLENESVTQPPVEDLNVEDNKDLNEDNNNTETDNNINEVVDEKSNLLENETDSKIENKDEIEIKNNIILENNVDNNNNDTNNDESVVVVNNIDINDVEPTINEGVLEDNVEDNVEDNLEKNVEENVEENVEKNVEENVEKNVEENVEEKENENIETNNDNLEENDIEEFDINIENLEKNVNFDESKNVLKLNENRLLFYKLYVLFSDQIKTHQVDVILGKLNEMNIEYDNFIDFLNKEDEIYLNEDNFTLA